MRFNRERQSIASKPRRRDRLTCLLDRAGLCDKMYPKKSMADGRLLARSVPFTKEDAMFDKLDKRTRLILLER